MREPSRHSRASKDAAAQRTIRIMTYNVHGCVGMDGRLSPPRIAKVIEQYDPDVAALQELDVRRLRSGREDQARLIAEIVSMDHHFHPAMRIEEEHYGDAILSKRPMRLVKSDALTRLNTWRWLEPRGALWVSIDVDGLALQVINTHLGLNGRERMLQIRDLLGKEWLDHPDCTGPRILCGDFNVIPGSRVWRECVHGMKTASVISRWKRFQRYPTWFGRFPMLQLDHIFVSRDIHPLRCLVGDTDLARIASDHRPLIADLVIE